MPAALQDAMAGRTDQRPAGTVITAAAGRAQSPCASDDGLASGLELGATAAAGRRDDGHAPHPEHRERSPGPIATAHLGPMRPCGSVRAASETPVSTSS